MFRHEIPSIFIAILSRIDQPCQKWANFRKIRHIWENYLKNYLKVHRKLLTKPREKVSD